MSAARLSLSRQSATESAPTVGIRSETTLPLEELLVRGEPAPIVRWGNPLLHRPSRAVEAFDADLWDLLATMFATNRAAHGVGLAANQIGIDLAVFVFDCEDGRGRRRQGLVCNPRMAGLPEPRREVAPEGCLSLPGAYAPGSDRQPSGATSRRGSGSPAILGLHTRP